MKNTKYVVVIDEISSPSIYPSVVGPFDTEDDADAWIAYDDGFETRYSVCELTTLADWADMRDKEWEEMEAEEISAQPENPKVN